MQLEGNLEQFPLAELIGMITASSVTGVLEIGNCASIGQIFCRDGQFYHAEAAGLSGIDAVGHVLAEADAPFQFTAGLLSDVTTITTSPEQFCTYVEDSALQWASLRQHLRGVGWIPVGCAGTDHMPERLDKTVRVIFAAANGERSVATIAQMLGLAPLVVAVALGELVTLGLVQMEPPSQASVSTATLSRPSLLKRVQAMTTTPTHAPRFGAERSGLLRRLGL